MQTLKDLGSYTFPALLSNSVSKFGKRNALGLIDGEVITYNELHQRSMDVSRQLYDIGLRKGDKAAIYSTSMPNWGAVYFGIVNSGLIAVPLLPDFSLSEVETILLHAEVKVIFVSEKMASRLNSITEKVLPLIIKLDDFSLIRNNQKEFNAQQKALSSESARAEELKALSPHSTTEGELKALSPESARAEELKALSPESARAEELKALSPQYDDVQEDDTASIIYTSGTTGRSKGVVLSHKNIIYNAVQCQTVHRVHQRDRCLSFLPLSHVYEFTIGFVMQMLNGSSVYYLGKPPTVSTLLPAFKKIRPTLVLSVPMIMEKIYKNKVYPNLTKNEKMKKLYAIPFFRKVLHRIAGKSLNKTFGGKINFFGIGGAKVDTEVEVFMKEAKFKYAIGYGLTETAPLLAGSGPKITVPGTVGPVVEGIQLAILNPDPETGIGEIVAKGDNVMKGYYKDAELTKSVFTTKDDEVGEGWFKTGDLGIIDKKNRLSIKGRLKNMILNSAGENIYPEDIEFVLNQHPFVAESLVVEDKNGLVALVQLDEDKLVKKHQETILEKAGNALTDIKDDLLYLQEDVLSEIQFFVNQKVNKISKLNAVKYIKEFEKTASQKIKRYLYTSKKDQ
ncbi:MAG: AMP-binding protein [Spirochaetaceae bacterium]|nr:AMP-binding protein [Spirochaetaceae bacterium]